MYNFKRVSTLVLTHKEELALLLTPKLRLSPLLVLCTELMAGKRESESLVDGIEISCSFSHGTLYSDEGEDNEICRWTERKLLRIENNGVDWCLRISVTWSNYKKLGDFKWMDKGKLDVEVRREKNISEIRNFCK